MAFTHTDKGPGDLIRSADWNEMGREITRLEADKVDLAGGQAITGTLGVRADLTVGTANAGAQLRVYRKQEDARDAAHGALVVGTDSASSASLRVGYAQAYSWLQGQGQQNLSINPRGGDVGVGTDTPRSRLSVAGGLSVGAAYASGSAAPANSLVVEGSVGIGTASPEARLHVEGAGRLSGGLDVGGALGFGSATRQMVNLYGTGYGIGVQGSTTYFRTDGNFAFYRGGAHDNGALAPGTGGTALLSIASSGSVGIGTTSPQARLHVSGGDLRLDSGREILFADLGQIRSSDDKHRILFRRNEDKLELREYGDIILSSGATAGTETAKAVLLANGNLGVGTSTPRTALDTGKGVMSGAANDYAKAQATLSGGGHITWIDNRLRWTDRFIAISANRGTSFSSGYVDISRLTGDIPAANCYDGKARPAGEQGVLLTDWDALYAVHTPGGSNTDVSFRIVNYKNEFNAPSNWILVAVRNGDNGSVKLGTGQILGCDVRWAAGKSILSTDQGGSIELGANNLEASPKGATPYIDFHYGNGKVEDYNARIINDADGILTLRAASQVRVMDVFSVSLACADFLIGHPNRRGGAGRALVDNGKTLELNFGGDWSDGLRYHGKWQQASSRALKDGIEELSVAEAEQIVADLTPVRYHLKSDPNRSDQLGFIAEDVPEQVAGMDHKAIVPNHIVAALTRVVKEQQRRLDELTRRLNGELANA